MLAKQTFYITREGKLKRQHNTVRFEHSEGHLYLPVEQIEAVYVMVPLELNTKLLEFFNQNKIPIHLFNYYGYYSGSFMPRESKVSGSVLVRQAIASHDPAERIPIAKEFLRGAQANIMKNIRQYQRNYSSEKINQLADQIENEREKLEKSVDIQQLMGVEGIVRKKYYQVIDQIMNKNNPEFVMDGRIKRPPNNKMNSLVSFINSLVYATTLNEIYQTHLNPTISFLHEPTDRRYSLSLDISEVFKPLLSDRLIFRLINLKMLSKKHFDESDRICYLNEKGRRMVIEEYHKKLHTTVKHRTLGRNVSYQRLIRLECYKLVKHILGEKIYSSFKIWW
ncbi:type I-B CRISPR-associated endonuclease Cas1b [Paenactinomyces guangxiensis]|uniref:CRISPR-associated endonuclease Cas1 n=1 Tax=Paenactinomyces guangxiensis TaxID=1490290 RepID=A0A7W1WNP7_9BACL|nr:type I-B CRISPR-associated endonuclease Cas1b [Paenactinomyces guangxiensis]MBA4493255.1 type I-B CRISPR-associated endonuclease Cas1 [Paenactinomyces guangxiensis]MBH8589894.1 type I-B CRISPR-associated endonuclease Cas1 [Paenactinomyces guangxiensis]